MEIFAFYIESEKYPNGININEPALTKEDAERSIRKDFEDINDNITHFEFAGIRK